MPMPRLASSVLITAFFLVAGCAAQPTDSNRPESSVVATVARATVVPPLPTPVRTEDAASAYVDPRICRGTTQEQLEVTCIGRATNGDTYRYVFKIGIVGLSTLPKSMVRMTTDCSAVLDFDITATGVALLVPTSAAPATCRVRFVSTNRSVSFAFTVDLNHAAQPSAREELPGAVPGALHLANAFRGQASNGFAGSPDSGVAVGPGLLVLTTNDAIQLRTKGGDGLAELPLAVFFTAARGPGEDYVGDPSVAFDPLSARFFVAASAQPLGRQQCAIGTCRSHLVLAISRSAAPSTLGSRDWLFSSSDLTLDQDTPTQTQSDWSKIAVSERSVAVSVQPESLAEGTASGVGSNPSARIRVFDKQRLLAGATAPQWQDFVVQNPSTNGGFRFQAATNIDAGERAYFASLDARDCALTVWAIEGTVPDAQLKGVRVPWIVSCAGTLGMVQPAPGVPIFESGLGFEANLIRRGSSLWGVYTMRLGPGAFASQPSYLRWFQLDISAWPEPPRLVQQGLVGDGTASLSFPAITATAQGDMAMVFNRVSEIEFASAYYAGRLSTDLPGTLRPMAPLQIGTAVVNCVVANVSGRNGFADYSGAAIDPADDTAWFVAQAAAPGDRCDWVTFVGHVEYRLNR